MPVTLITGRQATDTINSSQVIRDVDDVVRYLEPDSAPFTMLTRKLRKRKATAPKVEWIEQDRMPIFTTLSASAASNATALGVTDNIFRVGDVVRITDSGEGVEVTATAAGAVTVTRAIGVAVTAGVTAASTAELFIVGNVNAEGASLREIKTVQTTFPFNYVQIERHPTGLTGTDAATSQYGGIDRNSLRRDAAFEHYRAWETTALQGAKRIDTSTTGSPKRFAGGIVEFVTTNVTNVGGTLTEAAFNTFLRTGFRYGGSTKILLAAPVVAQAINGFPSTNVVRPETGLKQWGNNISTYLSPFGTVDIMMERFLLDSANLKGWGFLIDVDHVFYAYLRDTKLLTDRQAPDADTLVDEWLTEATFAFTNEKTHAILKGVTG